MGGCSLSTLSGLPNVSFVGYTITEEIGGGGYAKWVPYHLMHSASLTSCYHTSRVYRATHFEERRVAACKVVFYTEQTTDDDQKMLEREVRIHSALTHANVIAFINAVVVDGKRPSAFVPGVYMLLELAAGGDLFDKIGESRYPCSRPGRWLINGVCSSGCWRERGRRALLLLPARGRRRPFAPLPLCPSALSHVDVLASRRTTSTARACAIAI